MLKTIWFDFGGVLSPPLSDLFDSYEAKTGVSRKQLWSAMEAVGDELGMPALAPVELAAITEADWGRRLAGHLDRLYPGIDLSRCELETFGRQWFKDIEPNFVMISTLRRLLDAGFTVGILTNNVIEWEPYWTDMVSVTDEVAAVIDSCRVGARKPDPEIFRIAGDATGTDPADCVLIDDLLENCQAARREGWQAVHFKSNDQVVRDLAFHTGVSGIL